MLCLFGLAVGEVVLVTVRKPNVDNVIIGLCSEIDVLGVTTPITRDPPAGGVLSL